MDSYKLIINAKPFSYDKRGLPSKEIISYIKAVWVEKFGNVILPAPIAANFEFVFARGNKYEEVYFHTTKPDIDNCTKGILNALTGTAYLDDRHIVRHTAEKHYGKKDEIIVILTPLKEIS